MMLTIETLFNDPSIVSAVINRVQQTRSDVIYWQQYLDFKRTTTRVFKDYLFVRLPFVCYGIWRNLVYSSLSNVCPIRFNAFSRKSALFNVNVYSLLDPYLSATP